MLACACVQLSVFDCLTARARVNMLRARFEVRCYQLRMHACMFACACVQMSAFWLFDCMRVRLQAAYTPECVVISCACARAQMLLWEAFACMLACA
jgi:hypothetical protein